MPVYEQRPDGTYVPASPLGWMEEHSRPARAVLWLLRREHCGKPARRTLTPWMIRAKRYRPTPVQATRWRVRYWRTGQATVWPARTLLHPWGDITICRTRPRATPEKPHD